MSQATQSAPPPGRPAPAPAPAGSQPAPRPAPAPATRAGLDDATPRRLARLRTVLAAAAALAGILLALLLARGWQATTAAVDDTSQLVRAQAIKTNLLRADALATNAFLVGGLEDRQQRAAYDAAVSAAIKDVAAAADAQPADKQVLTALSESLVRYTTAMEAARTNNRQGFPVGAGYLSRASTELRSTALPLTDAVVTANSERAQGALDRQSILLVLLPGLLGLLALLLANQWLAARFKRRVNPGLATAGAILLVLSLAALALTGMQRSENSSLLDGDYSTAVEGAAIRSDANDAKAQESLRLIARGSGAANEKTWGERDTAVRQRLDGSSAFGASRSAWTTYRNAHAQVVKLDDGGDWDGAVVLATQDVEDGSTRAFDSFDNQLRGTVDRAAKATTDRLASGQWLFPLLAALALLGGGAAAASAWSGVTRRLEEYA